MTDNAWRELHEQRFPELPFDCGNDSDPGIIYGPDLRDWSTKATTPDQYRIENYIDRLDLRDKRLLHIGVGNSGLARRFHRHVKEIVGTTIDEPEIKVAQAFGYPNYSVALHNKYSGGSITPPEKFDLIIDNNLTSPCCCVRHLAALFSFFNERLAEGGLIVTDREGLAWVPDDSDPRWSFDFDDLAAVAAVAGFATFRGSRSVYVLPRSTPPAPSFASLSRHIGRRARALPGKILRNGPRRLARIFRKASKRRFMSTVRSAVPAGESTDAANAAGRLANLFIVGAPKCGTTAWVEYLRSHPDIFFPNSKEDCYFALDLPKFRFIHSEEEYSRLFADSGGARVVGEASAMYLFSEAAAGAIRDYNPGAKVLIFLREQEEYLPSLHNQFLWEFSEEIEDFETAWRLSGRRPPATVPDACLEPRTLDYAAMGRFREQVERYLTSFPTEQVRVIHFRDWVADPRATYLEILDFLKLADDGRTDFPRINPGVTYRSRSLARFVLRPPKLARRVAQSMKALTGPFGRWLDRRARKVGLMSMPGYKKQISSELRDEIQRHYAEDNRMLEERLRGASDAPSAATAGRGAAA
jgi:hypothetical protein